MNVSSCPVMSCKYVALRTPRQKAASLLWFGQHTWVFRSSSSRRLKSSVQLSLSFDASHGCRISPLLRNPDAVGIVQYISHFMPPTVGSGLKFAVSSLSFQIYNSLRYLLPVICRCSHKIDTAGDRFVGLPDINPLLSFGHFPPMGDNFIVAYVFVSTFGGNSMTVSRGKGGCNQSPLQIVYLHRCACKRSYYARWIERVRGNGKFERDRLR